MTILHGLSDPKDMGGGTVCWFWMFRLALPSGKFVFDGRILGAALGDVETTHNSQGFVRNGVHLNQEILVASIMRSPSSAAIIIRN